MRISIHALRGEGDDVVALRRDQLDDFNPRPPWGGRREAELLRQLTSRFQSTPSVGRATRFCREAALLDYISIHALRGEGDQRQPQPLAS